MNSPSENPPSALEQTPRVSGSKLMALIFVLWLPLPIIAIGVMAWFGLSIPLMAVVAVGTIFSLGLAMGAAKTR